MDRGRRGAGRRRARARSARPGTRSRPAAPAAGRRCRARRGPVGQAFGVELLQIAAARVDDGPGAVPERRRRRRRRRLVDGQPADRRAHVVADQVDHGVDVDPAGHVADEVHERRHADEREQDADREREVRREGALVLGAHAAQHHQRIGERAEEGAERELDAAVAGEVAQQARPHLPGGQRQRRDGDREHRAGDADRRSGDRAEQRACAGAAAVVDPLAVEQPLRDGAAAIEMDEADGAEDAEQGQRRRQEPEGLAQVGQEFAEVGWHVAPTIRA